MTDDLLDLATAHLTGLIPVLGHMGVRVVEVAPGRVAAEAPFEGNANHVGTMYAGVLYSVAEVLGGVMGTATFDASRYATIIKGAEIRYLRAARTAVRSRAVLGEAEVARVAAEVEAVGKSDFVLEVEVTDADGTVVARLRGDYQLRAVS
ncbi:MAG TPA: YiiD C-terminal domain-containing protein [Mycobacteriales bacterium]|nr:YiiD C-terminal domain-containing protein [Mycobacteriales bacterium]